MHDLSSETQARGRRAGPGNDQELGIGLGGPPPFRTIRLAVVTPSFSFRLEQVIWLCLALQADRQVAVYSRTAGIQKTAVQLSSASRPFLVEPVQVNQVRRSLILMQGFA